MHILGCGAALPLPGRNPTAQLVNVHEKQFLLDCGEGTQISLKQPRIRMMRIEHIAISHLHGDHYFGLPGLLSTFNLLGRTKPLRVYGPEGLEEIIKQHDGIVDCLVVGVPDERFGQRVVSVVSRADPALDDGALLAHCREHLAGYKLPKNVLFVDHVQRAPNGKADYKWAQQTALDTLGLA